MKSARSLLPAFTAIAVTASFLMLSQGEMSPTQAPNPSVGAPSFDSVPLNEANRADSALSREVAPTVRNIGAWISAVGAAVAVADLDGNGRDDEVCLVDPRNDSVTLFPSPSSTSQFSPVRLDPPKDSTNRGIAPMGCVPVDLDEDGDQDMLVYYWGRPPLLFLNTPAGWRTHDLVTEEVWNTTALNVLDVDGDGHLDILVGNYFPDGARVLDPSATNDSRLQMQAGMAQARNGGHNRLLLITPLGADEVPRVTDQSTAFTAESASSWTLAFGAQDLTGDGLPELYVANDFGPDQLLVNKSEVGAPSFDQVAADRDLLTPKSLVLGRDSFKGMGVAFTNIEANEMPSIAVSNITSPYALHESNFLFEPTGPGDELLQGNVPYRDRAQTRGIARSGWSWDIKAADFDNTGTEELIQATGFVKGEDNKWPELQELAMSNDSLLHSQDWWMPVGPDSDISGHEKNRLFALLDSGKFVDVAPSAGFASESVTRGFAVSDVNGDGLPDVLAANQWEQSTLFQNTTDAQGRHFLELTLEIPTSNGKYRAAVGAKVKLTPLHRADRPQYRQLYPANGHAGASTSKLHFGLGADESRQEMRVEWYSDGQLLSAMTTIEPGQHSLVLHPNGTVTIK